MLAPMVVQNAALFMDIALTFYRVYLSVTSAAVVFLDDHSQPLTCPDYLSELHIYHQIP